MPPARMASQRTGATSGADKCTARSKRSRPRDPRLGSALPHLRRDRAHPSHICTGTGLTPPTSAPGPGSPAEPEPLATGAVGAAVLGVVNGDADALTGFFAAEDELTLGLPAALVGVAFGAAAAVLATAALSLRSRVAGLPEPLALPGTTA